MFSKIFNCTVLAYNQYVGHFLPTDLLEPGLKPLPTDLLQSGLQPLLQRFEERGPLERPVGDNQAEALLKAAIDDLCRIEGCGEGREESVDV